MILLDVIQTEKVAREERMLTGRRETCDCCGEPFCVGHLGGGGNGRGWGAQKVVVHAGGRWWVVCCDRCGGKLTTWLDHRAGRVPRLVGREMVASMIGGSP